MLSAEGKKVKRSLQFSVGSLQVQIVGSFGHSLLKGGAVRAGTGCIYG